MKEIDTAIPIKEQLCYGNSDYNRYYKKPFIYQNGDKYLLCSQWYEYQREYLNRWINELDSKKESSEIKKPFVDHSDDFRFSRDSYIKKGEPTLDRINERIGTPVHINYLKMSENDSRRHKSRCAKYDKKKNVCMCVKSPYFTMKCGGSAHCDYYFEKESEQDSSIFIPGQEAHIQRKKAIEIISIAIQRRKKCLHCQGRIESHMIDVDYLDNGRIVRNRLPVYECVHCNTVFILDTMFMSYTRKKNMENISVSFKVDGKEYK